MVKEKKLDNSFPKWKPQRFSIRRFKSEVFEEWYNALRNSSHAFIGRKDVRDYIFKKYNNKCYICGSSENLQIDHIISIWRFAKERIPFSMLNSEENLAAICLKCNSSKKP